MPADPSPDDIHAPRCGRHFQADPVPGRDSPSFVQGHLVVCQQAACFVLAESGRGGRPEPKMGHSPCHPSPWFLSLARPVVARAATIPDPAAGGIRRQGNTAGGNRQPWSSWQGVSCYASGSFCGSSTLSSSSSFSYRRCTHRSQGAGSHCRPRSSSAVRLAVM